ncbi:MAG TPA: ATPase, T2SS/T4P/T4SS family [Roseiarcus sp.]|jgi:general secretion pathway protein E|nr:ATPase, T2SS/T4P/T4SS family [Roseiarcus sp.]
MNIAADIPSGLGLAAPSLPGFVEHLTDTVGFERPDAEGFAGTPSGERLSLRSVWEASGLSSDEFAELVAAYFKCRRMTLADLLAAKSCADRFARRFLREATVFPFDAGEGRFGLAVADPTDVAAQKGAQIVLGEPVIVAVASFDEIGAALSERLGPEEAQEREAPLAGQASGALEESIDSLRDLASGAPVVRAVNDLLERAVELRASDIHIEPMRNGLNLRMRVDGLLRAVPAPAHVPQQALISRIKILAGLNIAERRLPQDGAARVAVARADIDIRVATMPTQHGESAVIRLLPRDRGLLDIAKLGLRERDERKIRRLADLPHGMIVITGPTGSGKTTTLATLLSLLNTPSRKILTVEDPVEYEIAGINQSQVKPSIGLTFATALRSFVRQDPDVIMVGEVRDAETGGIAVHAALTGHLVLTTLHTETAIAAVPRLLDLGVEGFLLKSTLRGVIGQRLVRLLCERCKTPKHLSEADFAADPRYETCGLSVGEVVWAPRGCEWCGGIGYRGRIGVFEALEITGEVRDLVRPGVDSNALAEAARRAGLTTMMDDAIAKCRQGVTSVAEALRVTTAH